VASKRISHSLLDPVLTAPVKKLYPLLHLPRRLPPEVIVIFGHFLAVAGAVGFAFSLTTWWGGFLAALGVAGNHLADCLDGTHARATKQCRNGGELLDHFCDPLSFSYWLTGIAVALDRLDLGVVAVTVLFATAILTNIRAKLTSEFTLDRFGPTEFKTLLVLFGFALALLPNPTAPAFWFYLALTLGGLISLKVSVVRSVIEVNRKGAAPDQSEWVIGSGEDE